MHLRQVKLLRILCKRKISTICMAKKRWVWYNIRKGELQPKLEEYKNIAVWVLKGNERAIHFYERYGFQFDESEQEIMSGTPNTELRMILKR